MYRNWSDKSFAGKIFYLVIDFPLTIVRDLTIPSCDEDRWSRTFFVLMPITCPLFILLITESKIKMFLTKDIHIIWDDYLITAGVTAVLLIVSIMLCRTTYRRGVPRYIVPVAIIAFVMSIFWIWCVAKVLVTILKIIGVLFGIPDAFLGMTLLAIGNSAPDLSLNCALAKAGYGEMALAGSVVGPLFNLLVGLGALLIKKTIESGGYLEFNLFTYKNLMILISIGVLLINLLRLLIQGFILKFRLSKSVSVIGYILYFGIIVACALVVFVFDSPDKTN